MVGFKGWNGDDFLILLVLGLWTAELTMLQLIGQHGTNAVPPDQWATLGPEEIWNYELGSKYLITGWVFYTSGLWCMKGCMLLFYRRLLRGIWLEKSIKYVALALATTYLASLFTIFFHCSPFRKNWQVIPDPGGTCTLPVINTVVIGALNIATDLILLLIPVPLLIKVNISLLRKFFIGSLLSSGIFVIIATVLRIYFCVKSKGVNDVTIWAVRECTVALLVINLPIIAPFFIRHFGPGPDTAQYIDYDMHQYELSRSNRRSHHLSHHLRKIPSSGCIELDTSSRGSGNCGEPEQLLIQTERTYEVKYETSVPAVTHVDELENVAELPVRQPSNAHGWKAQNETIVSVGVAQ